MKKILSIILVIITLVALAVPIVATETISGVDITKSSVTEDLETIYNLSDYKADSTDNGIYLITAMEYGFGTSDHTLYLYFFNPSKKPVVGSDFNKITVATACESDGKPTSYNKCSISVCSISTDKLFIKCKLNSGAKFYYSFGGARHYSIGEVELYGTAEDVDGVKSYECGYTFSFSGSGNSLSCNRTDELTIKLDVHQTSYLTGDSAKGEGYSNQINSVYFSIPQAIEAEYGNLYAVDFEYYKYRTAPIILTDNQLSCDLLMLNRGLKASKGLFLNADGEEYILSELNSVENFGYLLLFERYFGNIPYEYIGVVERYNDRLGIYEKYDEFIEEQGINDYIVGVKSGNLYDYIFNVFKVDSLKNSADSEDRKKILVSANKLQKYFEDYNGADPFGKTIGSKNYPAVLFESSVLSEDYSKENHYVSGSYTLEDKINLPSWVDVNYRNWFIHFINGEWGYVFNKNDYDNTVEKLSALELVTAKKLSSETVVDDLKVSSSDVEALDEFYTRKNAAGENTYLLRYAWTDDYYSNYLSADNLDGNFLMVEETVYLDFDIISLSFEKNGKITVIPVVADPTDGFTGIQNTVPDHNLGDNVADKLNDLKDSLANWWKDSAPKLLGLGILIVSIVLIAWLCIKIPSWAYGKSDTSDFLFSDKKDKDKENNTTVNITIQEDKLRRRSNYSRGQYRGSYRYNGGRRYNSRYRYRRRK